jgi:preprotein translocase subunit SecY
VADQQPGKPRKLRTSVKGPLMFSAFWAVLAFVSVLIFASGGSAKTPRFDLAFTGAGIAFIVTLVIAAMLSMSYKENAEHLGKGSGINLSSAKNPSHGFGGSGQGPAGDAPETPDADGPGTSRS